MANLNGNNIITESDEIFELCCDLCRKTGIRNAEVDGFCSDCVQYFCAACLRFHQIFLPSHKHLDKHAMPKDLCVDLCTMHNDEVIKFYCKHCEEFICSKCKSENHEQCQEVHFLPLLVKGIENSIELSDFVSILNQFEAKLDNTKASINANLTSIDVMREETLDSLKKQKLEIQHNIKIEIEQLNRINQTFSDKDKLKNESDMKKVLFISNSFNVIKQELSDMKIAEERCKLYMTLIKSKPIMKKLEQELQDIQQHISITKYKYKPKTYTVQMQDIGEIEVNGERLKTGCKDQFSERDGNYKQIIWEVFDKTLKKYNVEYTRSCMLGLVVGIMVIAFLLGMVIAFWLAVLVIQRGSHEIQIAVKVQTIDIPKSILEFCILNDDSFVWFYESPYGVLTVKHGSLIDIPYFSDKPFFSMYKPWAIAKISSTEVAITIPDEMTIKIFNFDFNHHDHYKIKTYIRLSINVRGNPYGIDYIDEKLFVVVYSAATQRTNLQIFSLDGSLLKTFAMELYGNQIPVSPFKMNLDASKDYKVYLAYVLDASKQRVIGLIINDYPYQSIYYHNIGTYPTFFYNHNIGTYPTFFYNHNIGKYPTFYPGFSWKIKEDSLGPTAMAIDMEGYVYVCCDEENNIYKISSDLRAATVVLGTDKDMPKPTSMFFWFNKLFIASAQSNIRVFEIQKSNLT